MAVAPVSLFILADFSFGVPAKASFALGVGRGLARVVSGKVVQRNREGFKVTTPHATVGIRGTILTADVRNPSQSKFILSQLGAGHVVSVVNASTGQHTEMPKAGLTTEAGAAGNVLRPATPAEMSVVQTVTRQTRQAPHPPATGNAAARGTATAARAQAQSSTAAKNPATMSTPAPMAAAGVEEPTGGHRVAGKGHTTVSQVAATAPKRNEDILHVVTGNLADSSAPGDATPDSRPGGGSTSGGSTPAPSPGGDSSPGGDLTPGPAPGDDSTTGGDLTPDPMPGGDLTPGAGDNPSGITASYQGTLMGTESSIGIGGTFGFDVNLGSGGIDNGVMVVGPGTSTPDSAVANSFTNGTGQMDRDNGNFNVGDFTPDSLHPDASASMNGNISGNDTVTVEHWEVQRPGNPGGDLSGTGSGSKVSP